MFHPGTTTVTRNRTGRRGRRNGPDPKQMPSRLVHDMNRLSMRNQIPIPYKSNPTFGNEADASKDQFTSKSSHLEKDEATRRNRKIHRVRRLQKKGGKWTFKENDCRLSNRACIFESHIFEKANSTNTKQKVLLDNNKGFTLGEKTNLQTSRNRQSLRKTGIKLTPEAPKQEQESVFSSFIASTQERQSLSMAERLKTQGNDYFKSGDYQQAIEVYSKALELIKEEPEANQLSSVLLTNRAAVRIHQMDVISALEDCLEAMTKSGRNIRSYTRAASCYLNLGNCEEAEKLLEKASMMLSAEDLRFKEIIQQQTQTRKLKIELEALKADFSTGGFDRVIEKCDLLAKSMRCCDEFWRISVLASLEMRFQDRAWNVFYEASKNLRFVLNTDPTRVCWWSWTKLQISWHDPHISISEIITLSKDLLSLLETNGIPQLDTSPALNGPLDQELVKNVEKLEEVCKAKDRGNRLINQKKYGKAEEAYTTAINKIEAIGAPPRFWAVLYCNRGAAFHGQGLYLDAIRDACIALSLNPDYAKPYLRLGQMYLELDLPSSTCGILNKMRERCRNRSQEETDQMESLIEESENQARGSESMNGYRFMGLSSNTEDVEIKKKFKKLALKVHPDKAPNAVRLKLNWTMKSGHSSDKESLEVRGRLLEQMQHLFKQLNEANSNLMDQKDQDKEAEEMHNSWSRYYSEDYSTWRRQNWYWTY